MCAAQAARTSARWCPRHAPHLHVHPCARLAPLTTPTLSPIPAKVTFGLHPSFAQAQRVCTRPPYEVTETGWGEFDITITVRRLTCAAALLNGWGISHPPWLSAVTDAAVAICMAPSTSD